MRLRLVICLALSLLCGGAALAQNTSAQEARKAKLEREIAILDKQLSQTKAKSKTALSQLQMVNGKMTARKELLAESESQIRSYSEKISIKRAQIAELQRRVDTLSLYYTRLVRGAYRNRDAKIWYMYIIASDNIAQAFRRYSYFRNLSENMKQQALKLREAKAELEAEKTLLGQLRSEEETVRAERASEVKALEKEKAHSETIINELKKNRKTYEAQLATKRKQVEDLNREIQRIIAAAMKKSGKSSKTVVDEALSASFASNKGKLPWPVEGSVVGKFGQHNHPVFTNVKLPFNNGVDIAVAQNAQIGCIFDGVVKQIVLLPGYNQCVLVQHGGYFTLYCKLKTVSVKAGDKVLTGQKIGIVDTIGGDTQLHFEIWKDQTPQNPETWLK